MQVTHSRDYSSPDRFLLRFFRRNIQQLGTATDSHNRLSMILKVDPPTSHNVL